MGTRIGCAVLLLLPLTAAAADAARGARLYLQLPGDAAPCASCHGADPAANRNNILRAAEQPAALLKALGTVGVMGYLRPLLSDADVDDLAAYLGVVSRTANHSALALWPRTVDFGTLALGAASPPAVVQWRNQAGTAVAPPTVQLDAGRFDVEHDCRITLPPGDSCSIRLRAVAASVGDIADTLRVGSSPHALVGVVARVRAAPLPVWQADVPSSVVDFGSLQQGERATRSVVLRNVGTAAGEAGSVTLTGPGSSAFEASDGCALAGALMPGQACAVGLVFRPGAVAAFNATLQWRGEGSHAQTLELRAQAQTAPAPPLQPMVAPSGGGGGGCAAAPGARPGDVTLPALLLAALAALRRRRQRSR